YNASELIVQYLLYVCLASAYALNSTRAYRPLDVVSEASVTGKYSTRSVGNMGSWRNSRQGEKSRAAAGSTEAPQVTFSEVVSAAKERAFKRQRIRRAAWLSTELFFLVALLALLVLHSFRLSKNTGDNKYAQWSSSWVMILLSVLLVVVAIAVFVTYYYYRTVLAWIRHPATTDADLQGTRAQDAHKVGWRCLRPQHSSRPAGQSPYRLSATSDLRQAPWVSPRGRNSRAWRQTRAHQRQHRRRQATGTSSVSSSSFTTPSYLHHGRAPQHTPAVP
ncbi:hypothetical protein GGI20_000744, partial [Coemansia sp. BCRC 34301]